MQESLYTKQTVTEVADCIFHAKFLTPEFCKYILSICEAHKYWETNEEDEFKTQDIYFEHNYPSLFETISHGYDTEFRERLSSHLLTDLTDMRSIFAIKYAEGVQTCLPLHNDESWLSGSIKLNNEYEGAELYFPRQNYSNKECEVGDILLWPANFTHPHECKELTAGIKYSLTLWSKYPENPPKEKEVYVRS